MPKIEEALVTLNKGEHNALQRASCPLAIEERTWMQ
jgi:hypothetical protein